MLTEDAGEVLQWGLHKLRVIDNTQAVTTRGER